MILSLPDSYVDLIKHLELENKCTYDSYHNIPAFEFFEIRETGNLQLLRPKPKTSTVYLAKLYAQIYDDYFIKLANKDAERYLELVNKEAFLETYLIPTINTMLKFLWSFPVNLWKEERYFNLWKSQVGALNDACQSVEYFGQPIDPDGNVTEEMERVISVELGIINMDLEEIKADLTDMRAKVVNTKFEFYDSVQNINEANQFAPINAKCLLAEYVAAIRSATAKNERAKLQQK